jgi:outer membrane protein assembly factor BamB
MRSISLLIITLAIISNPAPGRQAEKSGKGAGGSYAARNDSGDGQALSTSPLALPFKRRWEYLTDSGIAFPATIDANSIYLPLAGGRVVCLDRETGSLKWTSDPGGSISSSIEAGEKSLFIATRKLARDGSDAGASLKAVDKETGITLWARDYDRAFTSPLTLAQTRIYAGSADGYFYALSAKSGELVWKVATQGAVRGPALVSERSIYFGSDDGTLRAVEPGEGHLSWKFLTGGSIRGRPAVDERTIFVGSADGYVYAVDLATRKLKWRSRTGAAIEASLSLTGDRVLAASFDNFIYALDRDSGNRLWKRRMDNRIAAAPLVVGDATLVAPLRGSYLAVFLNSDGRSVNFFRLDRGVEIVADPVFSGDTLAISTDRGLVVAKIAQNGGEQTNARNK